MSNAPKSLEPPTTARLVDALAELVEELVYYRERRQQQRATSGRSAASIAGISAADLLATPSEIVEARSWAACPVDRALKKGMRKVGQLIFDRVGSIDALGDIVDRISARDPDYYEDERLSILNSALDGVGNDNARWLA
jgi:hypothetical protein